MPTKKQTPALSLRHHDIKEFLTTLSKATASEYQTTIKYLGKWQNETPNVSFADWLATQPKLTPATQKKHIRQAKCFVKYTNTTWNLGNTPKLTKNPPPTFSDQDFQALYNAFNEVKYPSFILPEFRPLYWQTLIHFASITALRRQAILGIKLTEINFTEHFVHIAPEIDKKNEHRYKPITPELEADILDLIRHYDKSLIHPAQQGLIFPWKHSTKTWYQCWNHAEQIIGKRFHLHDLKRFSGELALRAGATPLELQQHMDHADIKTTLNHYCRPQTTSLVRKIKVPIPDRKNKHTPMFGEGEILDIIREIIHDKLSELGIVGNDVSLDKFGIPTNLDHTEIKESEQRITAVRKKKPGKHHSFHLFIPNFEIDVEEGGEND